MVRNAGAVFTGAYAPASLGDYAAGPSHAEPSDVDDDLLDFENSLKSSATKKYEESRGRWAAVDDRADDSDEGEDVMEVDDDGARGGGGGSQKRKSRSAILEEEPDLGMGVAAAIKLASSKG